MNANEIVSEEEFDQCFIKANLNWRTRLLKEPRRIHYDYESDIIQLKFGSPGFIILHWLDADDDGFHWVVEDDGLLIVGVEIFYFRRKYAPRYPDLQAAYDAMCRGWGAGDWHIHFPPRNETKDASSSVSAFADILLECAHDPAAAISPSP